MSRFAFVDLETTGARPGHDAITEIAIVTLDDDGSVTCWSQLVNPEQAIPPFIQQLTGITPDMVASAPTFAEIAEEVAERLAGRIFVAHNARFDYGFLKAAYRRLARPFHATVLCTVRLSRRLYPQEHRHGLDALVARHGLSVEGERHRALADARLLLAFWQHVHQQFAAEHIALQVAELTARSQLPPAVDPDLPDELPTGPGVYLFLGEGGAPLAIGHGANLRHRVVTLLSRFTESGPEGVVARAVRNVRWFECASEFGSLLQERVLTLREAPLLDRKRLLDCYAWQCLAPGQPWQLVKQPHQGPVPGPGLFGWFRSQREAEEVRKRLAERFELCWQRIGLDAARDRPCGGRYRKSCRGYCVGHESADEHDQRLFAALQSIDVLAWPWPGAVVLPDANPHTGVKQWHVFDRWAYVATLDSAPQAWRDLLAYSPLFDGEVLRLLRREWSRRAETDWYVLPREA